MNRISQRDVQKTASVIKEAFVHCPVCGSVEVQVVGEHGPSRKYECKKCDYKFSNK
jgi:transposase-like protein